MARAIFVAVYLLFLSFRCFGIDPQSDLLIWNQSHEDWYIRDANSKHGNMYFFKCDIADETKCDNDRDVYCTIFSDWQSCVIPATKFVGIQFTTTNTMIFHCLAFIDHNNFNNTGNFGGTCDQRDGYTFENIPYWSRILLAPLKFFHNGDTGPLILNDTLNPHNLNPIYFDKEVNSVTISQPTW